uniref:Pentatricopeptide repeat-containing protein n=1 Tax=Rhizophora mucronata TaxID=61149 RepID=A0A2P2IRD3_RHIMU
MVLAGLRPTEATLVTVISASADIAVVSQGKELHGLAWRLGFESNDRVKTTLLDMYAKCGSLKVAQNLFELLREKRIVSWNAMITGYAMHGHTIEALGLFDKMKDEMKPDHVTFVGVLSACSHAGLVTEGRKHFQSMKRNHDIEPKGEHYACMVDILGRAGLLDDAHELITNMSMKPPEAAWGALLNACRMHGNVELAKLMARELLDLNPEDSGIYLLLAATLAERGKWDDLRDIQTMMRQRRVKKITGHSFIEDED